MPTNLDETELARLEALAIECQNEYVHGFVYTACNAVPALIAEIRRLRADIKKGSEDYCNLMDYYDAQFVRAEKLREKVEAREWLWECFNLWLSMPSMPTITEDGRVELWYIRKAAREAVHADRE